MSEASGGDVRYVIDRDAVAAEVERVRAQLDRGYAQWFLRQFATNLLFLSAIVLFGRLNASTAYAELPGAIRVLLVALPPVMALALTWYSGRRRFGPDALDVDRRVQRIARELRALGSPDWPVQALKLGVLWGFLVGIPVGLALMLLWAPAALPGGSRPLAIPSFVGITMVWTVPMAFVFRWLGLQGLKRMVKQVDAGYRPSV